jgi:hypothetical protein
MVLFTPSRTDAIDCASYMAILASIGVIINSIEYLRAEKTFSPAGLLNWSVCKVGYRVTCHGLFSAILDCVFTKVSFKALMIARIAICMYLCIYSRESHVLLFCSALILISSLLINLRHSFGRDGSDQMLVIVFAGLVAYSLTSERVRVMGFLFVAIQVTLSYVVAGYAKLISQPWLQGNAIVGILGTRCYGAPDKLRPVIARCLPPLARSICWLVISFECSFAAIWFVPSYIAIAFLIAGLMFHVGIAVLMGLNVFLWAFAATYPAVWYCCISPGLRGLNWG